MMPSTPPDPGGGGAAVLADPLVDSTALTTWVTPAGLTLVAVAVLLSIGVYFTVRWNRKPPR